MPFKQVRGVLAKVAERQRPLHVAHDCSGLSTWSFERCDFRRRRGGDGRAWDANDVGKSFLREDELITLGCRNSFWSQRRCLIGHSHAAVRITERAARHTDVPQLCSSPTRPGHERPMADRRMRSRTCSAGRQTVCQAAQARRWTACAGSGRRRSRAATCKPEAACWRVQDGESLYMQCLPTGWTLNMGITLQTPPKPHDENLLTSRTGLFRTSAIFCAVRA
jgi:hypothetical protein